MSKRILPLSYDDAALRDAADVIARQCPSPISVAIIAGSGIAPAFESDTIASILYASVPVLPPISVSGHASKIVLARISGKVAIIFAGRYHIYEGYSPSQIVLPVLLTHMLGIPKIIITNAAGGLRQDLRSGDILLVDGVINMTGRALASSKRTWFNLCNTWRSSCAERARTTSVAFAEGTYIAVHGPSYETRAEVRFFRMLGDCIGMSTVHEVHAAVQLGIEPIVISVITNTLSEYPRQHPLDHEEVLEGSRRGQHRLRALLTCAITTENEIS